MSHTFFTQPQDTTTNQGQQINIVNPDPAAGKLNFGRQNIELSNFDRLIDSSRINATPKKAIPVVKTVPYVPLSDTVELPVYNTFTGEFEFPLQIEGFDQFLFTTYKPEQAIQPIRKVRNVVNEHAEPTSVTYKAKPDQIFSVESTSFDKGFMRTDWILGIIILAYLVYGWVNVRFSKYLKSVVLSSYNYFAARKLQEESNVVRSNVFMVLNALFFINTSLLISLWFEFNHSPILGQKGLVLFFIILGIVMAVYGVKGICLALLDFIFMTKGAYLNYNANVFIFNKLFGIILLPLITIIPFVPADFVQPLFLIALSVFGLLYLMRIFRGLQIGIKNGLSILYLILYLCALEIFPILIVFHTIRIN